MSAVTAGDAGRIAITYMGSESCAPAGASDTCQVTAEWNTYVAIITDALSLTRPGATTTIVSGKVNHRVVHHGSICTSGTACTGDRSLLDMIDLGIDQSGRVGSQNAGRAALHAGLVVSQLGEFSFVLAKEGRTLELLPGQLYQGFLAVAVFTMLVTLLAPS